MPIRISIDTGGTFTDLVLVDNESGQLLFHKVASTPDDPGRALVNGIVQILDKANCSKQSIEVLVHGTTVATNTVLQRRGAKVAMITTAGFRDVLQIQRQDRPRMYDLRCRRAEPLIERSLRFEVNERICHDGTVQTPLDHSQLNQIVDQLENHGVEAVAVGLLHSYANDEHERALGRILQERLPQTTVCLSHELVGERSEYERFSTCAMNAYVQPVMQRYLQGIDGQLTDAKITAPLFVMKSNGGVTSASEAARQCVHTILSGPAGGVVVGAAVARALDENIITADMGGTSFDVAMIHEGKVSFARDAEMAGLALKVPMLDIHTVGAGGGSIGWVDSGGSLRVGPQSAGAVPGPASYGHGGLAPTVTDANLVLGRLAPQTLLGGDMTLDPDAARRAIHDRLSKPLGLSIEQAAEGIIRVVNATMTAAIRKLTVERGYDPRTFSLCPFGGAGPLHGAELAREMGVRQIVVPLAPGVTSAVGLLMSNLREDQVRTEVDLLENIRPERVERLLSDLQHDVESKLSFAGNIRTMRSTRTLGLRYLRQGYELPVQLEERAVDIDQITESFHLEHQRIYGFARRDQPVELVNLWVRVEVDLRAIQLTQVASAIGDPEPIATREIYFAGQIHETPIYQRDALGAGAELVGPAIIEQLDSTTVLWPKQRLRVDGYGQLRLDQQLA